MTQRSHISILSGDGDIKIEWDDSSEADRIRARKEVQDLADAGYVFFLATNEPADPVAAGKGQLIVRRLTAEEAATEAAAAQQDPPAAPAAPRRGRGRPPAAQPAAGTEVVAMRQPRGG